MEEAEGDEQERKTAANMKEAQRIVGELIWLVTRCRPDLMYPVSVMSMLSTRRPKRVQTMAIQVWKYLAATIEEGLGFNNEEAMDVQTYADASFGELEAQGCVALKWGI